MAQPLETAASWLPARFRALLPKESFARGVAVLAGGTAIGQGLVILFSPVVSRLYRPEDFGVLGVYAAFLGIATVIVSLRYEIAIPLPEDDATAANLLALALATTLMVGAASGAAVFFAADTILALTKVPEFKPYLWLVPVGIICAGFYTAFNYWAVRNKNYRTISSTKIRQGAAMTATQMALPLFKSGPLGLLLGQLIGQSAGAITLARSMSRNNPGAADSISVQAMAAAARRYRRFPLLSGGSSLMDAAGQYLPSLLLAGFFGPAVVGWFALSQRVIGAPLSLLGQSVAQVYLGEASRVAMSSPESLRKLYIASALKLLKIGVLPIALLTFLGPKIFSFVFGGNWLEAGRYTQLLAPMMLVQFAVNPLSQTLNILERQDLQLLWTFLWLGLTALAFALSAAYSLTASSTIVLFSSAMLLSYLAHFMLCLSVTGKLAGGKR